MGAFLGAAGRIEVDGVDAHDGEELLVAAGGPDHAREGVAAAQAELPDLAGGDVDVVGAGQVVVLGGPQEAEALGQHLQDALGEEEPLALGLRFQEPEDQFLLAHGQRVLDLVGLAHFSQTADGLLLQVLKTQDCRGLGFKGHGFPLWG